MWTVVEVCSVVVLVVSPQSGGVGLVAFLHVVRSAFFSSRHVFLHSLPALPLAQDDLQDLNSLVIVRLQSFPHLASTGGLTRLAANRTANAESVLRASMVNPPSK